MADEIDIHDSLSAETFIRLRDWLKSGKPAVHGFTAGVERQLAYIIEQSGVRDELTRLRSENDKLRAALATSELPCQYCTLSREDWEKCTAGFPGCARADDAMGCPHLGAGLEVSHLRSENASLREDISRYVSRDTERLAEVEKLREALKPFDAMGFFVNEDPDDRVVSMGRWVHGGKVNDEPFEVFYADLQLTVADIRRARAVLTGTEAPPAAESPSDATSTTKDT